ncbi:hypothetical protein M758_11G071900 [Ceratodon purpureus]|nr:hypothetical protein M758_11G071900 [Ceratodon purpureus]
MSNIGPALDPQKGIRAIWCSSNLLEYQLPAMSCDVQSLCSNLIITPTVFRTMMSPIPARGATQTKAGEGRRLRGLKGREREKWG